MKKIVYSTLAFFVFLLVGTACEQQEKTPPPQPHTEKQELPSADMPPISNAPSHAPMAPKTPKTLSLPDEVAGQWDSAVLRIEDKTKGSSADQTIPLHSEYQVPETDLLIKVGDFLPQFTMNQSVITSESNETKNPALKLTVFEKGEVIFDGWLFERFPDMHPFQNDRFDITLVGYNPKTK